MENSVQNIPGIYLVSVKILFSGKSLMLRFLYFQQDN